jgi:CheY-like chemotaxis protein
VDSVHVERAPLALVAPEKPTVLVVEDQPTARTVLMEIIRGVNSRIEILPFEDAKQALEWVDSSAFEAAVIFTDIRMAEMDGITFIARLRERRNYQYVPIVAVTSIDEPDIRYQALEAGATDFLHKPLDPVEVRARARNLLCLSEQHRILTSYTHLLEVKLQRAERIMSGLGIGEAASGQAPQDNVLVAYDKLFELTSTVKAAELLLRQTRDSIQYMEQAIQRPLYGRRGPEPA